MSRPRPSGLADVIDLILDEGLVVDAHVRVSLVGIELLTIDAQIVVGGVGTYLRFAEVASRLDIAESDRSQSLPDLLGGGPVEGGTRPRPRAQKGALGLGDRRR
jgi:hypothetical protein